MFSPGCLFRSVSGDYELLFWNPTTGEQVLDLEIMANIDWISQSCSISFETLGNIFLDSYFHTLNLNIIPPKLTIYEDFKFEFALMLNKYAP